VPGRDGWAVRAWRCRRGPHSRRRPGRGSKANRRGWPGPSSGGRGQAVGGSAAASRSGGLDETISPIESDKGAARPQERTAPSPGVRNGMTAKSPRRHWPWWLAGALLASLVLVLVFLPGSGTQKPEPVPSVRFSDVTELSGISFHHYNGATSR